jgi:class 3 adenylate cyclase
VVKQWDMRSPLKQPAAFRFRRSRGIVWVCDVAGSSSRLNSEAGVGDTEAFLPRLYRLAALAVESAGGKFIKWTGDGFLAWFETPLHRDVERVVKQCLDAVWHLTVIVNTTQLGLVPARPFKVRHGVAYEQDALLMEITHPEGVESLDLIGRAVVLAFRLSGVNADFPGVSAQREIVEAARGYPSLHFRSWKPSKEECLRYFKGERWSTDVLYRSGARKPRPRTKTSTMKLATAAVEKATGLSAVDDSAFAFTRSLLTGMANGPEWTQRVAADYTRFVREELLGSLVAVLQILEEKADSN